MLEIINTSVRFLINFLRLFNILVWVDFHCRDNLFFLLWFYQIKLCFWYWLNLNRFLEEMRHKLKTYHDFCSHYRPLDLPIWIFTFFKTQTLILLILFIFLIFFIFCSDTSNTKLNYLFYGNSITKLFARFGIRNVFVLLIPVRMRRALWLVLVVEIFFS